MGDWEVVNRVYGWDVLGKAVWDETERGATDLLIWRLNMAAALEVRSLIWTD